MICYYELLDKEEAYRIEEQSAMLSLILSTTTANNTSNRGKLAALKRSGLAMTNLEIVGRPNSGSGGRIIIELESNKSTSTIISTNKDKYNSNTLNFSKKSKTESKTKTNPCAKNKFHSCFKPGDLVKIILNNAQILKSTGTIEKRNNNNNSSSTTTTISISSNSEAEELEILSKGKISLIKIVDEVGMFEKMKENLKEIGVLPRGIVLQNDNKEKKNGSELVKIIKEFIYNDQTESETSIEIINETSNDNLCLSIKNLTVENDNETMFNKEQRLAIKLSLEMIQNPYKQ